MKTFFYKFRVPLLEWYFVAACCYFFMIGFDLSIWMTAVFIGFVDTYVVTPILFTVSDIEKEAVDAYYAKSSPTLKNVAKALLLSTMIVGIYYLINEYFRPTAVDAFTFGLLYWLLDKGMGKLIKKWKNYELEPLATDKTDS